MACLGCPPEQVIRAALVARARNAFLTALPRSKCARTSCRVAVLREKGKGQGISPEPDCPARRDGAACVMPRERRAAWNPVQGLCRGRLCAGQPCAGQGPRAPGSRVDLCMWCAVTVSIWELTDMQSMGLRVAAMRAQQICHLLFPKYMLLVAHIGWSSTAPSSCRSVQQACGLQCYTAGLLASAWRLL